MSRPRALVLFGGKGGSAKGFHDAGLEPFCVDLEPSPRNPFECVQGDAMDWLAAPEFLRRSFEYIHASPPCPRYSVLSKSWNGNPEAHPDLVGPVRDALEEVGLPYSIENVVGAPLVDPVKLCGSMFDLAVERHRLFETNFPVQQPACDHARQAELWPEGFPALRSDRGAQRARVVGVFGTGGGAAKDIELWRWAMGVDWMNKAELSQTIPPAYTEYIGRQWLAVANTAASTQEMAA